MAVADPQTSNSSSEADAESWEFAGWGGAERINDLPPPKPGAAQPHPHTGRLGQLSATAICGNDITSSCLYVSALAAVHAGAYAPIALALVAAVLYLFRKIYAEVGSALPLNGGTYTVLLNTTNKKIAASAAVLTLLSYVATAVISAGEAMHYAHNLWEGLDVFWATVGLLGFFAFLSVIGITESAAVAVAIFTFHMITLTVLVIAGGFAVIRDPSMLAANWSTPSPEGFLHAMFFGFAAAMLGISGFESSANFIEEQKPGVFPKTLRNMWLAVGVFNPIISLLSLGLLPLIFIQTGGPDGSVPPDLLAQMGDRSMGHFFRVWISIDAVLVLSGAVLTAYVGVTGLMRRMSLDRCLPALLLRENRTRGTNHWIVAVFFAVCCSILFVTGGVVEILAGVYALSFLSVMALFAIGNMLLKVKRARLPRDVRAPWVAVILGLCAVVLGLLGNLTGEKIKIFAEYFVAAGAIVGLMFIRVHLMKLGLHLARSLIDPIRAKIEGINNRPIVYFTKDSDPAELNRAALYVLQNEQTNLLKVVFVYEDESEIPPELAERLTTIDRIYPQLRIDFVAVKGTFGPEIIDALSTRFGVPKNYMFIGTPGDRFPHRIADLGGVRLIL